MKKTLIIARHSIAADGIPGQPDKERPLTPQGLTEAGKTAGWLLDKHIMPNVILVSPATRTRQTAGVYAEKLTGSNTNFQAELFLYAASASEILDFIKENFSAEETIMIVGHNPAVSMLAGSLSNGQVPGLAPAGAVIFQTEAGSWEAIETNVFSVVDSRNTES